MLKEFCYSSADLSLTYIIVLQALSKKTDSACNKHKEDIHHILIILSIISMESLQRLSQIRP